MGTRHRLTPEQRRELWRETRNAGMGWGDDYPVRSPVGDEAVDPTVTRQLRWEYERIMRGDETC